MLEIILRQKLQEYNNLEGRRLHYVRRKSEDQCAARMLHTGRSQVRLLEPMGNAIIQRRKIDTLCSFRDSAKIDHLRFLSS